MEQITGKEFVRVLSKNGFEFERQRGSHQIWKRGAETISVPVINLNRMLARRFVKEYALHVE